MKKIILFMAVLTSLSFYAQVAINTTNAAPDNFAMLDVSANQKGVLFPRITSADRTTMAGAMGAGQNGLIVYDTDTSSFWYWDGAAWNNIGGNGNADEDWYTEGTTNAPTDINDNMFHMGQVAIGQNTTTGAQLNVFSSSQQTVMEVNNANNNTGVSRMAAGFNVNGTPSSSPGITGVYSSVGGDPGNSGRLAGFETDMAAQTGINPRQYGFVSDLSGDSDNEFYGVYNMIHNTDGVGLRIGAMTNINGSGGGSHIGVSNNITSTGGGTHIGVSNLLGYDYENNTNTAVTGKLYGTLNTITDTGSGEHIGTSNLLGIIAPGLYVTGDSNATRVGSENLIGGDGDGSHYALVNHIMSTGNGEHIASINRVDAGGTGTHIAVYGEVDTANDPAALAAMFRGYTTSTNQVSTINLFSGNSQNVTNTSWQDLNFMEAGIDPTLYNNLGAIEVKVVIRVSSATGSGNKFRLRAQNNAGTNINPVSDTDSWTWTETDTTNHRFVVTSQWKSWLAGTTPWEIHLQGITDANMTVVNAYIMVRPAQ